MDESAQQLMDELLQATAPTVSVIPVQESPGPQIPIPRPPIQIVPPVHNPDQCNLMDAVKSSLLAGKFSDITIVHGPDSWKAHKIVVCSQSAVLGCMINQLENTSIFQLPGYDKEAFKLVMEYLYTATYTTSPSPPSFCLPVHLKVHDLATELQIAGLQDLAVKFFAFNLSNYVDNLEVFFSAVQEVYAKTRTANFGLRVAVVEAAVSEMRTLLSHDDAWKRFVVIMADIPEFQKDMMCVMADLATDQEVQTPVLCETCGPRARNDCYPVQIKCKGCGADKTLAIL